MRNLNSRDELLIKIHTHYIEAHVFFDYGQRPVHQVTEGETFQVDDHDDTRDEHGFIEHTHHL